MIRRLRRFRRLRFELRLARPEQQRPVYLRAMDLTNTSFSTWNRNLRNLCNLRIVSSASLT